MNYISDVTNAYFNVPCRENIFMVKGPEFANKEGFVMVIVQSIYELKSSANIRKQRISLSLEEMEFKTCCYDSADFWIQPTVMPDTGFKYDEICLIYVGNILCISPKPSETMDILESFMN